MSKTGPKITISQENVTAARHIIDSLSYTNNIVSAFVVLLEAQGILTQPEIAEITGISVATIKRIVGGNLQNSDADCHDQNTQKWGGDRRSLLSEEKAKSLLEKFATAAETGSLVTIDKIKESVEAEVGHAVTSQTIYNLLYRYKWRKVIPDKQHPKNEPGKIEEFKKKLSSRHCNWLPPKQKKEGGN